MRVQAQNSIGHCYQTGRGVKVDADKAFMWFSRAADQGLIVAQNRLGLCYQEGIGVAPDLDKAVEWFTKASDRGHPGAQNSLGLCFQNAKVQNMPKAVEWFTRAAEKGAAHHCRLSAVSSSEYICDCCAIGVLVVAVSAEGECCCAVGGQCLQCCRAVLLSADCSQC